MSNTVLSSAPALSKRTARNWIAEYPLLSFFVASYAMMFAAVFSSMWLKLPFFYFFWFFAIFSPTICALILSAISGGRPAVKQLLQGYTRWKVGGRWYLGALMLLLLPLMVALLYQGLGNPGPGLAPGATAAALLSQLVFTFISGPLAEEGGWRGFALPRLQEKYNALVSSLILGVLWTCWHIPLWFHPETKDRMPFLVFLILNTVLTTFITWLYNNTKGSLVITILAHFCFNLVGAFVTGTLGLMPMNTFLMFGVPGLTVFFVWMLIYFGPQYLSRKPITELPFHPKA